MLTMYCLFQCPAGEVSGVNDINQAGATYQERRSQFQDDRKEGL